MNQDTISNEEIQEVIQDIFPNETFTDEEIEKVKGSLPNEPEIDPTGYWRLWVENYSFIKLSNQKFWWTIKGYTRPVFSVTIVLTTAGKHSENHKKV
jgi:hypothetical protein